MAPGMVIQYTLVDELRRHMPVVPAACIAGAVDITMKTPFERVKTRVQAAMESGGGEGGVLGQMARETRANGLTSLWGGYGATLARDLPPQLSAAGAGADPARVINIGSLAGHRVERIGAYSYVASKAAIHHLSRELAAELAPLNITVNAVAPGYFPTRMTSHIRADERESEALIGRVPLARLGRPEDIAGLCIFLSSAAGAYLTGTVIPLDGGISGCL